jgi:hypothetical protein
LSFTDWRTEFLVKGNLLVGEYSFGMAPGVQSLSKALFVIQFVLLLVQFNPMQLAELIAVKRLC